MKEDTQLMIWTIVLIVLWLVALVIPFFLFGPSTFWEKIVFAVLEVVWAVFSGAVGFVVWLIGGKVITE